MKKAVLTVLSLFLFFSLMYGKIPIYSALKINSINVFTQHNFITGNQLNFTRFNHNIGISFGGDLYTEISEYLQLSVGLNILNQPSGIKQNTEFDNNEYNYEVKLNTNTKEVQLLIKYLIHVNKKPFFKTYLLGGYGNQTFNYRSIITKASETKLNSSSYIATKVKNLDFDKIYNVHTINIGVKNFTKIKKHYIGYGLLFSHVVSSYPEIVLETNVNGNTFLTTSPPKLFNIRVSFAYIIGYKGNI